MKIPPAPKKGKPAIIKTAAGEVTVYRDGDKFQLAWRAAGERHREKRSSYQLAVARAEEILTDFTAGGGHIRSFTGKQAAQIDAAIDALMAVNLKLADVVRDHIEAHKILAGRASVVEAVRAFVKNQDKTEATPIKFAKLVELFNERNAKMKLSTAYQTATKNFLRRAEKALGGKFVADITAKEIEKMAAGAVTGGPRAYNNLIGAVSACFTFAKKQGYLPRDKEHEAEHAERLDAAAHEKIEIYTPAELRQILDGIGDDFIPLVALGGLAGIRTAEIFRMTWEQVSFEKGFIILDKAFTKTKRRRIIPICDALSSWLKPLAGTGRIYARYNTEARMNHAVLDVWPATVTRKRNALRHSYATYRFAELQDEAKVASEMGNSPQALRTNYAELATPSEAIEWFATDRKTPEEKGKVLNFAAA